MVGRDGTSITFVGNNTKYIFTIGLCQGNCDEDMDCLDDIICYKYIGFGAVTWYRGTDKKVVEYCIYVPLHPATDGHMTSTLVNGSIEGPTRFHSDGSGGMYLIIIGTNNNGIHPIGLCQGDNDEYTDCLDYLICHQRDCFEPVPVCYGSGKKTADHCIAVMLRPSPYDQPNSPHRNGPMAGPIENYTGVGAGMCLTYVGKNPEDPPPDTLSW